MSMKGRGSGRALRAALRSPGRPPVARRAELVRFWAAIAAGRTSEDAAREAGLSPSVGARWFRRSGGMPPTHLSVSARPLSERTLSFEEREEIALLRVQGHGVREVARRLGRAPSTISRELRKRRGDPPRRLRVPRHDRAVARPVALRAGPGHRGSRGTRRCAAMWRTAWRAGSYGRTAPRCPARRSPGRSADRSGASTGGGRAPGAPSRSRRGLGRISPRTRRCASRTRRSISRSSSRAVAGCAES